LALRRLQKICKTKVDLKHKTPESKKILGVKSKLDTPLVIA
jgi:hypothetical protein